MATTNPPDINHSSSDTSLSFTKIHQGVDFDALIENAMNSSSEMVAGDNKAAAVAACKKLLGLGQEEPPRLALAETAQDCMLDA